MIIGAGGASRAVAIALAFEGASRIFIMNRTLERANELVSLLKRVTPVTEISVRTFDVKSSRVLGECSLVINCTPLAGPEGGDLPLDYEGFSADKWAIDLNYAAPETSFLRKSSEMGAKTADGAGMLLHQAAASFRLWTGQSPPLAEMRKAFNRATKG
jgi:shikimate dehydrogenase